MNYVIAAVAIASFFVGYFAGWYVKGQWESKKHLIRPVRKTLKEQRKKK